MSGILVVTTTDCNTVMARLVNEGVVVDRLEVDKIVSFDDEEDLWKNESEIAKRLWEER